MLDLNNPFICLKLLATRIAFVGMYLACFNNIKFMTNCVISTVNSSFLIFISVIDLDVWKYFKNPEFKSFTLILMLFTAFVPIFRTFLKEIDSNTTFLCFSICKTFFCIDSVGTCLVKNKNRSKKFKKHETISLEEGMLIPSKTEDNGVISNIFLLIGCFCTFSRLESNVDVMVLQGIAFILYILIPSYLDAIELYNTRLGFILSILACYSIIFILDRDIFKLFGLISLDVCSILICLIKIINATI
jgi:hypothetical protein